MEFLREVVIGLLTAVVAVLIMQNVPVGLRLSNEMQIRQRHDGTRIYRAMLRRRWWYPRIFAGPVDVNFYGRFVTGHEGNEHILEVPLVKQWRPAVGRQVMPSVVIDQCNGDRLRQFLRIIQVDEGHGLPQSLDDLFDLQPDAELRIYVFGYHRRTGTRWTLERKYARDRVKPGRFDRAGRRVVEEQEPPVVRNT
jgi:hypothetical protein